MHAIIAKQGFAVIVVFCYTICLFRSPVLTILKVVGCERLCTRERVTIIGGWGRSQFLQFFRKIAIWMAFYSFLEQLEKAKLLRFGGVGKNLFCSV